MLPPVKNHIDRATATFNTIPGNRKKILLKISEYISNKLKAGEQANLLFVGTHNSRRSIIGQIWGQTAAAYYEINNVKTFSAGTEASAFNPNAVNAIERAGFRVRKEKEGANPIYRLYFEEGASSIICFSKTYNDGTIPKDNLCAIMTCSEADSNCPDIPGTELRISCPYDDLKAFDETPQQEEKYSECCFQIATELLFVFSNVKK
ncbi:MAG TPA: protein-tyrosine-phosphatase [Cytophagaceae bacterium]